MTRNNVTATPEPETETHTYRCQQRMNVDEVRQVMRRRFSFSHEVDHVINRAVLCDGSEDGLVVRRGVDGREAVHTRRHPARDDGGQRAVHRDVIEALEKRELGGVRRRRLVERGEPLDHDMRVAHDVARGLVDHLRRGEVVRGRVDEEARVEVVNCQHNGEGRVRLDRVEVRRVDELGRGGVVHVRHDAHRRGVARSGCDLRAVREREVDRRTEVDEVVRRRHGRDFARLGAAIFGTVLREPSLNQRTEQRER